MNSECEHTAWVDLGPLAATIGRIRCSYCGWILDYEGDSAAPAGEVRVVWPARGQSPVIGHRVLRNDRG